MRILFLDLDTLRPDHLGCYGYHRDTSPNIDRIANEGVRFDNYYCSDAPCLPSRAALFSGMFGIHNGAVGHGGTAADMRLTGATRGFKDPMDKQSLTGSLRQAGFYTVTVSPFGERHSAFWFYAGFREMYNTGRSGAESAEEITPTALDWIERKGHEDNWFLHVNYWDPHSPYRAPEKFGNPFEGQPIPDWLTEDALQKHRAAIGPHTANEVNMYKGGAMEQFPRYPCEIKDMADVRRAIDGYDCGTRYVDGHIGRIFAALEKKGVMDDLAVIISSDHGENMGELGIYSEHATADYITCRIPMIIRWPGGKKGHADGGLHYNFDLCPTLAELLGTEPAARWDGQSYASTITDGSACGRDFLVLSQNAHVCQRSVRKGPWIWMRTHHDGYHLFPDEMLYNIEDDPHEQNDVASENADLCGEMAGILEKWHADMMASMPYDADPMDTVLAEGGPEHARGRLAAYCERLEATGRGWAIPELRKRHPAEFK